MFLYCVQYLVLLSALFAAGIVCLRKMLTVKPHRLKKETQYQIFFCPHPADGGPGEEWARFAATRGNWIGTGIFACLLAALAVLGARTRQVAFAVYALPVLLGLLHTLDEGAKRVGIHERGIVVAGLLRKRFYRYSELECLESYNILSAFHSGISYGYRFCFREQGRHPLALDVRQYRDIDRIERVFGEHCGVWAPPVCGSHPEGER